MRLAGKAAAIGYLADIDAFAAAQIALTSPFDFGEFAVANGLKFGLVDTCQPNHVLVAHDDRSAAIDDGAHGKLRLDGHADLTHQDQIEWRVERGGHLGRNGDTAARQRQDHRVLIYMLRAL